MRGQRGTAASCGCDLLDPVRLRSPRLPGVLGRAPPRITQAKGSPQLPRRGVCREPGCRRARRPSPSLPHVLTTISFSAAGPAPERHPPRVPTGTRGCFVPAPRGGPGTHVLQELNPFPTAAQGSPAFLLCGLCTASSLSPHRIKTSGP